jgi:zinc transporter ZupT
MILPLIILALISASGILLYSWKSVPSKVLSLLIGLGAGSMLAVALVHILYAFIGGVLAIYIIEEFLTPHHHDHSHGDHSHEDPHEHYDHVAVVSWIAIFVHTLLDGLGIRAGM